MIYPVPDPVPEPEPPLSLWARFVAWLKAVLNGPDE